MQPKKRPDCPHCNSASLALERSLKETENFRVVCDVHPLTEGHLLIIPKQHISCMGAFSKTLFVEFDKLYQLFSRFISRTYGSVSSFEHGIIGQTVFHAHVHVLPYHGQSETIIPEDKDKLTSIQDLTEVKNAFRREDKYLVFSIADSFWLVDTHLGVPRFFRDRFAQALGHPERGNWKQMRENKTLMQQASVEITKVKTKWSKFLTNQ
ncbi:MAG: HIT family protein [Candidatus Chisholmbacteria bacterium]|nr:HIT family protein [Candidatus Chisholmbacteria bacterium]